MSFIFEKYASKLKYNIEQIHSHPVHLIEKNGKSSMLPSGFNTKTGEIQDWGDSKNAGILERRFKHIEFKIYDTHNRIYYIQL